VSIFFAIACCLAEPGFVPSVGLDEFAVPCDECRLVPERQFVLVGYTNLCVRYEVKFILNKWNNVKVMFEGCRERCGR
jgi:hypothetical protein